MDKGFKMYGMKRQMTPSPDGGNKKGNEFREAINKRYSDLAVEGCCLSCGGAVHFAEPAPGEYCLDLGSGRGHDVIRMATLAGASGFACGIDISTGMIAQAEKNAEKMGVANVRFIHSELHDIKLPNEWANLVISNCTINHAPDKRAVWREIYRVLKPGGRFVVSDIYSLSEIPAEFSGDPKAVAECWAGAVTREEYLATLEITGFRDIKIMEESQPYRKGQIETVSFTVSGWKKKLCCSKI